jgi:hypothetical protein
VGRWLRPSPTGSPTATRIRTSGRSWARSTGRSTLLLGDSDLADRLPHRRALRPQYLRPLRHFDSEYTSKSKLCSGTFYANELYPGSQNDPYDIAVVFDKPIRGIESAQLPTLGQFDSVAKDQQFTAVGYGEQEAVNGPDDPVIGDLDTREYAVSTFSAVGPRPRPGRSARGWHRGRTPHTQAYDEVGGGDGEGGGEDEVDGEQPYRPEVRAQVELRGSEGRRVEE